MKKIYKQIVFLLIILFFFILDPSFFRLFQSLFILIFFLILEKTKILNFNKMKLFFKKIKDETFRFDKRSYELSQKKYSSKEKIRNYTLFIVSESRYILSICFFLLTFIFSFLLMAFFQPDLLLFNNLVIAWMAFSLYSIGISIDLLRKTTENKILESPSNEERLELVSFIIKFFIETLTFLLFTILFMIFYSIVSEIPYFSYFFASISVGLFFLNILYFIMALLLEILLIIEFS